jgi:hypothetical protein
MPVDSGLYVPSCTKEDGQSQPLATALWLEAGKHLCQQHFLQRCRTVMQIPSGQGGAVSALLPEKITLEWRMLSSGVYEGQPQNCGESPIAFLASTLYKLQPVE